MKYADPRNPWLVVLIVSLAIIVCSLPVLFASHSPVTPTPPLPIQQTVTSVASPSEPAFTAVSSRTPVITYQPAFEPAPCAFPVPRGYDPECVYLIVPENRTRLDSRQIRLHVAIFRNRVG